MSDHEDFWGEFRAKRDGELTLAQSADARTDTEKGVTGGGPADFEVYDVETIRRAFLSATSSPKCGYIKLWGTCSNINKAPSLLDRLLTSLREDGFSVSNVNFQIVSWAGGNGEVMLTLRIFDADEEVAAMAERRARFQS